MSIKTTGQLGNRMSIKWHVMDQVEKRDENYIQVSKYLQYWQTESVKGSKIHRR